MKIILGTLAILLCLACLVDLPRAAQTNKTLYGFFLKNGQLTLTPFVATILSANLSLGNFLVFAAVWGFLFGWAGLFWFLVNLVLNVIAYIVFIPAFRRYIEDTQNSGTIHEFLSTTFGRLGESRRIRLVASSATVLGLLFAIVFEIHLAADIFARLLDLDIGLLFILLTLVICIYSGAGGFHTLIFTDVLQSIAMSIGAAAAVAILIHIFGASPTGSIATAPPVSLQSLYIGWANILSICVIGSGWFLVAMDQWQRSCATRSASRTSKGMLWYLFSISGFAVIFGAVGIADKVSILPNLTPDVASKTTNGANPLVDFFFSFAQADTWSAAPALYALVAICLLAAAMSTANTFLIVCGHSFVSDLLLTVVKQRSIHTLTTEQNEAFVGIARGSIIGMGVFVVLVWWVFRRLGLLSDPLSFFFIAYSIQFALLAPMIAARLPKPLFPSEEAVFYSILVAIFAALLCGIGLWSLLQQGVENIFSVATADWLALSPVFAATAGMLVLISMGLLRVRR